MATAPCAWPISYADCTLADESSYPPPLAEMSEDDRARIEAAAVEHLWRWTGSAFGLCEVTLRPCRVGCDRPSTFYGAGPYPGPAGTPWMPVLIGGSWYNLSCGTDGCSGGCSCTPVSRIGLPGPVASVSAVVIDGTPLDPTSYRVDNGHLLVRQDGAGWPYCNDLAKPDGEEGTWSVTYERGVEVPVGGQIAAGIFAVELAKAWCNDSSCQLPKRLQSLTRQGITIAMLDSFDDVDRGHTGIFAVDSWIASVTKSPRRSRVMSPDYGRLASPTRTTWLAGG
jgi:hypothetical protein